MFSKVYILNTEFITQICVSMAEQFSVLHLHDDILNFTATKDYLFYREGDTRVVFKNTL